MKELTLNHWLFGIAIALTLAIKPNQQPIAITCTHDISAEEAWYQSQAYQTLQRVVYEPVDMPSENLNVGD